MTRTLIKGARARCEFDFHQSGSVLKGTVDCAVTAFRTHLEIDSDEPAERIAHVIRLAKKSCFAEQLVKTAVPLTSTFAVNGESQRISLD
jgi:uncharacterized OsmC-like protein